MSRPWPELTIRGLHKRFGPVEVLRGVDLQVSTGEFCVLVGPSGCGKSTLLRTIAGLEEIQSRARSRSTAGEVNHVRPRDRDIAMVFQNYALYPYLNGQATTLPLAFAPAARPEAETLRRVNSAAELLGIAGLLDRFPRHLSGGQRQRVAIGRAIVRNPKLFLFDEPLSNLDAQLRDEMRSEIKRLHQELAATMIYVTHDQIEAMTLADRIVLMNAGQVEQVGAPLELYDRPATQFVAGFLGSPKINLLAGQLIANGGSLHFAASDGTSLLLPSPMAASARSHLSAPSPWRSGRSMSPRRPAAPAPAMSGCGPASSSCSPPGRRTYGDGAARRWQGWSPRSMPHSLLQARR